MALTQRREGYHEIDIDVVRGGQKADEKATQKFSGRCCPEANYIVFAPWNQLVRILTLNKSIPLIRRLEKDLSSQQRQQYFIFNDVKLKSDRVGKETKQTVDRDDLTTKSDGGQVGGHPGVTLHTHTHQHHTGGNVIQMFISLMKEVVMEVVQDWHDTLSARTTPSFSSLFYLTECVLSEYSGYLRLMVPIRLLKHQPLCLHSSQSRFRNLPRSIT